jgi:hypothetical protein
LERRIKSTTRAWTQPRSISTPKTTSPRRRRIEARSAQACGGSAGSGIDCRKHGAWMTISALADHSSECTQHGPTQMANLQM